MNWMIIVGALLIIGGIGNIFINLGAFIFGVLAGGILLYFGIRKRSKSPDIKSGGNLFIDTFEVVGECYCSANIQKLANTNPNWKCTAAQLVAKGLADKRVYRCNYTNTPVVLQPEPNNEHDKNAVAVYIAGQKVGYISRNDNQKVKAILSKRNIKHISSFVGGGQYKIATSDGDLIHQESDISINVRIRYV